MSKQNVFKMRASVLAVQGALLCFAASPVAYAADTVDEILAPTNTVEIGIVNVDKSSAKFGEYNGLGDSGTKVNGSLELNGGDPATARRFRIVGKDLGLDNRSLTAEYGSQGLYRVNFGYDELQKNRSDTYMTPYLGSGTATLLLPAIWETNRMGCAINSTATGNTAFGGASTATPGTAGCGNYYVNQNSTAGNLTAAPVGNAGALTAAELAAFNIYKLQTKRSKTNAGLSFILAPEWTITANAKREEKKGAQAIGQAIGGAAANSVVLANPIDYVTNDVDVKVSFAGEKAFAEVSYFLSSFDDQIKSLTYQNPWFSSKTPTVSATGVATYPFPDDGRMATAPSNQFRQMNLTGGYNLSKTTKFVGYWSSGIGTQTETYLPAGTGPVKSTWVVPRTNLGGEVVSTTYGLKLTSRPVSSLNLGAAYKYDERQNNSSVASYTTPFNPQDGTLATTNFPYNLAYSRKLRQLNLDADWAFNQGQAVKLGVEKQDNTRWCNNLPTSYKSGTTVVPVGSCVNASDLSETTSRLEYRNSVVENVTGRIGFASSNRTASTYGPDVPFYNADIYTRFIMTDRKRDKIRTSVSWAPAETVDLTVNFESTQDRFALGRNPSGFFNLGLDSVDSKAFNLDATFVVSENVSVNAFFSIDDISSLLKGSGASSAAAVNTALAAVAGGAFWNADINDRVETIGLSFQAANLMGSKLDLTGSYIRSKGTSPYALTTGSYLAYSSGATTGVSNTLVKSAVTGYPETFSTSESLSLTGKYQVSKKSAVKVVLTRETLASADPAYYLGLQMGAANAQVAGSSTTKVNNTLINASSVYPYSTLLPTNEQAPAYSVTAIGVSYIFSF